MSTFKARYSQDGNWTIRLLPTLDIIDLNMRKITMVIFNSECSSAFYGAQYIKLGNDQIGPELSS